MKRIFLDNVKPLTAYQLQERRKRLEYEKTKFYINRLPSDVYIRDRSGLLTKIRPWNGNEAAVFEADFLYICEQFNCTPEVSSDYVNQARRTENSMRQYAHKVVLQDWLATPISRNKYTVEAQCGLSIKELLQYDGIVYVEEHDIVVMYGLNDKQMEDIHHPYTLAGYTYSSYQRIVQDNPHIRKGDFTFNIRIVDNSDQFGSRWILIDDTPFCIVASKDHEVTDGIYITYSKNLLNGKGPQELLTDRFDFSQGANLPYYKLYESQQEALLARRGTQIDEAQAKIKELESKATTAETNLRKAQQERENLEREAEFKRMRHEQDMEKLRRDNEKLRTEHDLFMRKQAGESLLMSGKNTTELIKCVPAILSAVAVTISLFNKKKNSD